MGTVRAAFVALCAAMLAPAALVIGYFVLGTLFHPDASSNPYAWEQVGYLSRIVLMISGLHVWALGLPIAAAAIWMQKVRWWVTVSAGLVVGCIPAAVVSWPLKYPELKSTSSYWNGERMVETIVNGVPTMDGWIQFAAGTSAFGALGATGGLAFWVAWRACR